MDHECASTRGSELSHQPMYRPLAVLLVACIKTCATIVVCIAASDVPLEPSSVEAEFEEAYQKWDNAVSTTGEVPRMFTASFRTALPEFKRITAIGIRAAPYLVQKMRESPPDRARLVLSALIDVTRKRYDAEAI